MRFLDQAKIWVSAGGGGGGCVSFLRTRSQPRGGPDGGDGGAGGDVWAEARADLATLIDFRHRPHWKAEQGASGGSQRKRGAVGDAVVLHLPTGTEILDPESGALLADLTHAGARARLARGGAPGRGNASFRSSTNRAPRNAAPPTAGEERSYLLRLRLLAEVGLLGLPNAGKSSLLAQVSRARPKVAAYPFTTRHPQLGVVDLESETEWGAFRRVVFADVPGLIEGAHRGSGLGLRFLGHLERCSLLLHLVDGTSPDPLADVALARTELLAWEGGGGSALAARTAFLLLNKTDLMSPTDAVALRAHLEAETGIETVAISAKNGDGCADLLARLRPLLPPAPWRGDAHEAPPPLDLSEGGEDDFSTGLVSISADPEPWK